jgi:hypothetical protein
MVSLRSSSLLGDGRLQAGLDLGIHLSLAPAPFVRPEQRSVGWIFVGGSGKNVGRELLAQCDGRLPDKTFAVAIDSDPDPCGLPPEMVLTLTLPQANLLVERRKDWPSIDRALPASYRAGCVSRGSSMKRPLTASIVLLFYDPLLREELAARFVRPMLAAGGPGDSRLRGGRCRVVIHLVSSLSGGFGSATLNAIPALVRHLFREVHERILVEVVWHAFTSNVHRDVLPMLWQKSRADANAFAALLEFEASYHDSAHVPWESLRIEPFSGPLIDQVKIYDRANEQGGLLPDVRDMYSMVAAALLTESLAALNDTLGRDAANVDVEAGLSAQENASAPYGSTVAHRLIFPAEKVARFAVLEGLRKVTHSALAAPRLHGSDLGKLVRECFQASGLPGFAGRLANELRLPTPQVPTPASPEEWETAAETLLQARHDHDGRLAALEPRAVDLVDRCGTETKRALQESFQELLATPSRHTPHDVAAVFDEILVGANKLLEQAQTALGSLDLPALAARFERSLAGLREVQARPLWFKRRKLRLAHLQAANDLAAYARAGHRVLLLRATADALGRVRPALQALPDRARKTCQAGQAALRALEGLARAACDRIGQHQIFVREAVDGTWAEECVKQLFAGTDWARWADDLFGKALARLASRKEVEDYLNGEASRAVEEVVRPKLAGFHVTSEEMLGQAVAWLHEVADRAAPHFSFDPVKCGEHGQTYFAQLLAVGSRAAAERLLEEFPTLKVEVVETGDPHQIVFTAQRRLVPLHAAINNLRSLERAYRYWVARTADNPQAEVHSNRKYTEMDREGLIANMLGRQNP